MTTLKEITIFLLAAFMDLVTTTPTPAVNYTLYGIMKTWNEARAVCESNGQQMLKLDTEAKFDDFMVWKNIWEANGLITADIWTGLHQHVLTDPTVFNLEWHDCEPLGSWAPWHPLEPNFPDKEECIRIHYNSNQFRTTPCQRNLHVVCQEPTEECTFERFDDQDIVLLTSASSINVSIDDCQRACLTYTGNVQCVAIVYQGETTSCGQCRIYTRQQAYINDNPEMTSSSGGTVLVKRCIQGNYMLTNVSVPTNTESDPVTACPVTTGSSSISIMTSEPITVLSTCPGTTMGIHLSILTNTQSTTVYSSYATVNEGDPEYQSVYTSTNIFPETNSVAISMTSSSMNSPETFVIEIETSSESHFTSTSRMYSVGISVTPSSVKTPVIETESHLTSTMTSHDRTPISIYSSTSSESLYWSIDHLPSIDDSTTAKTVSVSNVVPLETLAMTMSESSQITTLPGVADTSSEGTKSTSTSYRVSDSLEPEHAESSTQASSLDLDPSTVALSTGSHSPRERHRVCVCMQQLMSMTVDVGNMLDRKKTSSYRRSKTSASDDRVSARTIGASGLAIIILITVPIVCVDVDRMIRAIGRCRKR